MNETSRRPALDLLPAEGNIEARIRGRCPCCRSLIESRLARQQGSGDPAVIWSCLNANCGWFQPL